MESIDGVRRVPVGPLPRDRARPRGQDEGRRGRPGVRAGGAGAQPPRRGALAAAAPAGRQRGGRDARRRRGRRSRAPRPTPRSSSSATGCSATASRSTWTTSAEGGPRRGRPGVPAAVLRRGDGRSRRRSSSRARSSDLERAGRAARASAAGRGVEVRAAERGDKRRLLDLAERNAKLALDQERLKAERRRQQRVEALDDLQEALQPRRAAAADRVLRHLQPHGDAHRRVDGRLRGRRAEEGRLPALHDPRRRARACPTTSPSMSEVLTRRLAQWETPAGPLAARPRAQRVLRDAAERDRHRRRQGPARRPASRRCAGSWTAAWPSSRWPSASRRSSCPAAREPIVLAHDTPALQLLQRVRDEAHRFAITHHRTRRDRAMTASVLDDLPGHRPDAQARRCSSTSARPTRCWPRRASSSRRCPGCRARPPASSTRSCTGPGPGASPHRARPGAAAPAGPLPPYGWTRLRNRPLTDRMGSSAPDLRHRPSQPRHGLDRVRDRLRRAAAAAWTRATSTCRSGSASQRADALGARAQRRAGARPAAALCCAPATSCSDDFADRRRGRAGPRGRACTMAARTLDLVPIVDDDGVLVGVVTERGAGPPLHPRVARGLDASSTRPTRVERDRRGCSRARCSRARTGAVAGRVWVFAMDAGWADERHRRRRRRRRRQPRRRPAARVELGVALLVISNGVRAGATRSSRCAREHGTAVVASPLDSYVTGRMITLAAPCRALMDAEPLTVRRDDLVADISEHDQGRPLPRRGRRRPPRPAGRPGHALRPRRPGPAR